MTEVIQVYVPKDSAARSVGADDIAAAIAQQAASRQINIELVRNGSRGMFWLEPLVEVLTPAGRVAYGPVSAADVEGLFDSGFLEGKDHRLSLGLTEAIPYLASQNRVTFARMGLSDPLSVDAYMANGGLSGLKAALSMSQNDIVLAVTKSGIRGRGGAGFPTGIKWKTVLEANSDQKFVCCNADEGDSGTYADRMLMEGDPLSLIEAMIISGIAVGATEGYIYVRSEYPDAISTLKAAIAVGYQNNWLGQSVLGSDHSFDLYVRSGAGAYICGEETAMLESLEGRRGVIRAKPPLPAIEGLFQKPTVVNNVLSLAAVPSILAKGPEFYSEMGIAKSRGTQVFQLSGNIARPGIVEVPFGVTLDTLINEFGGGSRSSRPVKAAQVGGPLGSYIPSSKFDLKMDYETFAVANAMVGHGGIVVFDDTANMGRQARFAMEFCSVESCGKCTPCRIGSVRGVEVIDRILSGQDVSANVELLKDLCQTMIDGSLCAMGGLTPMPVLSVLEHFPEELGLVNGQLAASR